MRTMLERVRLIAVALAATAVTATMLLLLPGAALGQAPVGFAGMPVDSPPSLAARSAIIAEAETGQVLYQMNADERVAPASITKIMTMLLVMERVDAGKISLDDSVTVSRAASLMGGSQVYLKEKEVATVGDLLAATAIRSANDASFALAEYVAGTDYDFVSLMNARARELGMTGTHFSNPEGLDDVNHYTTARDILTMSRELVRHSKVLEWTSTWIGSMRGGTYDLFNTNRLIRDYPGADGLKTGHTDKAGYCLAGTAMRNGVRLISVVLGTASEAARTTETAKALDYGFRSFEKVQLAEAGSEVGSVKVPTAAVVNVPVIAERDLAAMIPRGASDQITLELRPVSPAPAAPIAEGQQLGTIAAVGPNGDDIAAVPVAASKAVKRANVFVRAFRAIADFFRGLFGKGKAK